MPSSRAARLLYQLPRTSRVFLAIAPSNEWGWKEILLNQANHNLEVLIWSKTEDALKKRNYPKPFVPPFMEQLLKKGDPEQVSMSIDELKEYLTKPRQ